MYAHHLSGYLICMRIFLFLLNSSTVFSQQSRIMKHAGDLTAAAALADEARGMDLADRYINSECVKRMLQADQVYILVLFIFYCFGRCPLTLSLNASSLFCDFFW